MTQLTEAEVREEIERKKSIEEGAEYLADPKKFIIKKTREKLTEIEEAYKSGMEGIDLDLFVNERLNTCYVFDNNHRISEVYFETFIKSQYVKIKIGVDAHILINGEIADIARTYYHLDDVISELKKYFLKGLKEEIENV